MAERPLPSLEEADDPAFWAELHPETSVGADDVPPWRARGLDGDGAIDLLGLLRVEGHLNLPDVFAADDVARLRRLVADVAGRGLPAAFAFVYDEPWRAFAALAPLLAAALGDGYRAIPDFWAWHVAAADDEAGWRPHRDRSDAVAVDADGSPRALTAWVALTDATPLNGCIYLVPAHVDAGVRTIGPGRDVLRRPQDARAQPAPAGSLLVWNHGVLHWGGRSSRRAAAPRVSAALQFQRGDIAPFARPLFDPHRPPAWPLRMWLLARVVLGYAHMTPLDPAVAALVRGLSARHYARVAAAAP
ncbi:MAG TPA: phytanoyl-CoA dioxygenase family protein [Haliangiales bacterium]|nr:phytanoyl-CoA dioxygenase family protein [Haliangiales bacterium]